NKLLSEKLFILKQVQRIYKYILIDEGQDTNKSQFELITNLCGDNFNNLFIVADEDQLIFEWNNAKFEYLDSLVKKYGAETIQLYETYRCPSQILNAANNLIKHNKHRIKSKEDLIPTKESTEQSIEVNCFKTQDEEAIFVCNKIKDLNHHNESCVISRNRYILEKIQDELGRLTIPFYMPMGQDRYITREMNLIINLMRLIFNEDDKIHLYYICEYLNLDYSYVLNKDDEKTLLQNFIDSYSELCAEKPIVDVLNKFKSEKNKFYSYYAMLKDILIESDNLDDDLSGDIELFEETYTHYCRERKNEERDLRDFLNYISFSPRTTTPNKGVTLLTAHASKGLEFDYVFLISMNQGIYPDFRAKEGSRALEEERRNCYVSITRAKEKLYISYTKIKQTKYGLRAHNPSQFIEEMKVISNSNVEN
ncbi:MAG TPA: ATP-dependent helicase, partial [Methanosarcinaceae archaeon]|nr:ATP-dependent helicase [Methanosarcinaceae archaeon]